MDSNGVKPGTKNGNYYYVMCPVCLSKSSKLSAEEEIQREIEKQEIRNQIIAFERRRQLEAEVRRELAMEHKLSAFQSVGGSGDDPCRHGLSAPPLSSFPIVHRQQGLSFNVKPEEKKTIMETERLLFQRDPQAVAGMKRKGLSTFSGNESKKKKNKCIVPKQKEWDCLLCKITATSEVSLHMHMQGRKHKASMEAAENSKGVGGGIASSNIKHEAVSVSSKMEKTY